MGSICLLKPTERNESKGDCSFKKGKMEKLVPTRKLKNGANDSQSHPPVKGGLNDPGAILKWQMGQTRKAKNSKGNSRGKSVAQPSSGCINGGWELSL